MDDRFVEVVVIATKKKQFVPRHHLDHPVLGRLIELPPSQRETPSDKWTVERLKKFADDHDIDLGDATLKADILAALTQTSEANPAADETPANGDDEGAK